MTIRRLIFVLFLYILLIWIIALLRAGDTRQFGLLWTAVGVAVLLAIVLLERVIGWWWVRRAQKAARPAAALQGAPAKVLHEDDLELLRLVREADQRLGRAQGRDAKPSKALDLPVYLVLGPERAGKTAILHHSGIEPPLLAGQVTGGDGSITPTRVANLWLARDSLFLEVSGRVFNAEPSRLAEFLTVLQPWGGTRGWRRWLRMFEPPVSLRGTLLVVDSRAFAGTPEPSLLDRSAQQIRERLAVVSSVLGGEFPVCVIFTNADALPYFEEFFSGVRETEAGEVLGVLTAAKPEERTQERVWAEAETRRLNRSFMSLFLRLSDRRLLTLSQETEPRRKGAIYEFPREFKRIRTPLVQFLVDIFKPDPLRAGPHLRGFFFTGTRKVERMPAASPDAGQTTTTYRTAGAAPDATQIFAPHTDMTTIFRARPKAGGSGPLVNQWMFLTELFHSVLGSDRPSARRAPAAFERYRKAAVAAAAGLALVLSLIWTISCVGNWRLITAVRESIRDARGSDALSLANLQALDRLREQLVQLDESHPLLHWGLYQGTALREEARKAYFERLRSLSLNRLNQTLMVDLMQAGAPGNTITESAIYDALKAHRTITADACRPVDPVYISRELSSVAAEAHPGLKSEQQALLFQQLQFYAADLAKNGRPVSLNENSEAEKNAQAYLGQIRGPDQRLLRILEEVDGRVPRVNAADKIPGLQSVLKGQENVRGAFTPQGRQNFEDMVGKLPREETCLMGTTASRQAAQLLDPGMKEQLQSAYYTQYIWAWHEFLASYHVLGYPSVEEAAGRLDIMSRPKSPLLGLIKLVAANTNFPTKSVEDRGIVEKAEKLFKGTVQEKEKAKGVDELLETKRALTTAADVTKVFQPVWFTTSAESDSLVSDQNQAYVDGLAMLQGKMDALANASAPTDKSSAMAEARIARDQARNKLNQMAYNFRNFRNEGMDTVVSSLLEEPIRLADPWLKQVDRTSQKNQEFISQVCSPMRQVLGKYPFNPAAKPEAAKPDADVSLGELEAWFAPNTGKIWKYASGSGAELVVPKGGRWEPNPMLQDMKVAPELLTFLNGAQMLTKAFFGDGKTKPGFTYKLRALAGQAITIQLKLDGIEMGKIQTDFSWPVASGSSVAEGTAFRPDGSSQPFGRYTGLWAVFRLFDAAEPREPNAQDVQWDKVRGDGGQLQPFSPAVKVEILSFPGGVDVFQPALFESVRQCPKKAAEELKQ